MDAILKIELAELPVIAWFYEGRDDVPDRALTSPPETMPATAARCASVEPLVKLSAALAALASKEAELVRLRGALVAVCRVFPTDLDMAEAGWSAGEINTACNVYDQCQALTTQQPKEPT